MEGIAATYPQKNKNPPKRVFAADRIAGSMHCLDDETGKMMFGCGDRI
ncbi:hypothetical protein [Paraburkholderia sartisoli]|nr:hypothetical protein [Paraburkholderia sartisoli]